MRLELRVTLWLLVLLGLSAAATLTGMAWFHSRTIDRQTQETGSLMALSVKSSLRVSMLNDAPEDVRESVKNIQEGATVESVTVYGRNGGPWVSSAGDGNLGANDQAVLLHAMKWDTIETSSAGDLLTVFAPVRNETECLGCHSGDGPILGAVGVSLDERPLRNELSRSMRNSLFLAAIPLLMGLIATIWAVRRSLLRPLAMVGKAAGELASGDLSTRLPPLKGWEFSSVETAFNDMAERLARQATDLTNSVERLRSDLEGMEEIQSLVVSGAGLREILARSSEHLSRALAASGAGVWLADAEAPEATWGHGLPPADSVAAVGPGAMLTSAGPIEEVAEGRELTWVLSPAVRGGKTMAILGITWDRPRRLARGERDLIPSVAGLVAVAVENAELLERLRHEEEELEGALKKTLTAQEEERRRLARELHDETSQILHALMMNIDLIERQLPGPDKFRARLRAVKALAEQAGRNLDKVLLDLRPALLDELGLVAALRWYVSQVRDAWGLPIEFEVERPRRLPGHIETATFRIGQEAVGNAVRHSKATRIWVSVRMNEEELHVEVRDDGTGFDVAEAAARARTGEAAGMLGMRERAELLGGHLEIESAPGEGTRLHAVIPLAHGERPERTHGERPEESEESDERERQDQSARG